MMGKTPVEMKAIQNYIKAQIYFKGFSYAVVVGNNSTTLTLGGSCRFLYGIQLWMSNANIAQDDTFSLNINNEQIFDTILWRAFNPAACGGLPNTQFFPVPRPLSGSDTVQFSWTAAVGAKTIYPIFYLSNYAPELKDVQR